VIGKAFDAQAIYRGDESTLPMGFSWQLFVNAMRLDSSKMFVMVKECFD
jgi:hypothetical protein